MANTRQQFVLLLVSVVLGFSLFSIFKLNNQSKEVLNRWSSSPVLIQKNKHLSPISNNKAASPSSTALLHQTLDWKTVNVSNLKPQQIIDYFHWANSTSCKLAHDFGGKLMRHPSGFDGQKSICLDPKVRPSEDHCIIYSFGINNSDWSFDETMEKYGCRVFSFDPSSMNVSSRNQSSSTQKIQFFNFGLASRDYVDAGRNWTLKTLSSTYKMLLLHHGEAAIIDYLKIDIDSAEWDVLPQIISSGMLNNKVRQLGVTFHLSANEDIQHYRSRVAIIKSIEDAGMVRFSSKYNPWYMGQIKALGNYTGSLRFEIAFYR